MLILPPFLLPTAPRWMNWLVNLRRMMKPPNTYAELQAVCGYDGSAFRRCQVHRLRRRRSRHWRTPSNLRIGRPAVSSMDVLLYNWNIATSAESPNPYIGSGKLDGNGIPADFFSDVHIRKAFAYCFDCDTLINDVFSGEAIQSLQLTLPGMPGFFR